MKKNQIKWLSLLLLVSLFLGCEKEHPKLDKSNDEIVSRFFKYPLLKSGYQTPKNNFTLYSIEALKEYNEEVNFVPNFVEKLGFADWKNSRYFKVNNETILQTPIYSDNDNEVKALIVTAQNKNRLACYVIRRNYFDEFVNNKTPNLTLNKVIDLFILADFKVFGKSDYLPNGKVLYDIDNSDSGNQLKGSIVHVETCYYMEVYNSNWTLLDARWECETSYEYVNHLKIPDGFDLGGGGGSINFGGFGGGSGGIPAVDLNEKIKSELCDAFSGIINLSSVKNNLANLTQPQEQFIISLANLAAFSELSLLSENLKNDLVNFPESSPLYSKYSKLNNYQNYITGWTKVANSSARSNIAFISPEINNSNFQLKFYPEKNGEHNALGLVKEGSIDHSIEAALEFIERWFIDNNNKPDDFMYDMHLYNALNFMGDYCNE